MNTVIPTHWTATQAAAVVDFLNALYSAIWDSHEPKLIDYYTAQELRPEPDPHDPADLGDDTDLPF